MLVYSVSPPNCEQALKHLLGKVEVFFVKVAAFTFCLIGGFCLLFIGYDPYGKSCGLSEAGALAGILYLFAILKSGLPSFLLTKFARSLVLVFLGMQLFI